MIRATRAQINYVHWLHMLGAPKVDQYTLTISTANAYIKEYKIIGDYDLIGDLRPEELGIPNH